MKIAIIFLLLNTLIMAHPHVFMEAIIRTDIGEDSIRGIEYEINMDEMNSLVFINQYDEDGNGDLDIKEGKKFIEETFGSYRGEKNHFKVRYNDKVKGTKPVLKDIYVEDFYLTYIIYIPLNLSYGKGNTLNIAVYDNDYFYDYYYDEYSLEDMNSNENFSYKLEENNKIKYYMGTMHPMEYEVTF